MRAAVALALACASAIAGCTCGSSPSAGAGVPIDARLEDGAIGLDAGDATPAIDAGERADSGGEIPRECAAEICYDGLDGDCDGAVDEDCTCEPGEMGACFRGDPRHRGVGACRDGTFLCTGGIEFGLWGPCEGDAVASAEACDIAGIDEDCDGAANEGCECFEGDPPVLCGTDEGECIAGEQACIAGRRTECAGAVLPLSERCNALDDDCDGAIDEDLQRACGSTTGTCRMGLETCEAGVWGECLGGRLPSTEACDALDNDCDGSIDERVERICGLDRGRCVAGIEACIEGAFAACEGRVDPIAETCNAVDDDCDGTIDEALIRSCGTTDVGECALGLETCTPSGWSACTGALAPAAEACDGARDEDCDGMVDEGCDCAAGAMRACGSDIGACVAGTETCSAAGAWGACERAVGPRPESCNAIDDDCDGPIDEMLTRACGTDVGACVAGTETCSVGAWGACAGSIAPAAEACDGSVDQDCDGMVDEGCACTSGASRPCGTDVGACAAGTQTCTGGAWGACLGAIGPSPETCDGARDEDCDGMLDEGCLCTNGQTRSCGTDVGACVAGTERCDLNGTWGACSGSTGPGTESCNGTDDDCDARTDESLSRPCGTDVGECVRGTESCAAGAWGACTGSIGPSPELCEGARDEDCDGAIDDGCLCTSGQTRACGSDVGECVAGTETCSLAGAWGACTGSIGPSSETCDGADDDCDTRIDEGACVPPSVGCPADRSTSVGTAVALAGSGSDPDGGAVSFAWSVVSRPPGSSAMPMPASAASTSFEPDAAGSYTLRLCVTDDELQSSCCTSVVTATSSCTPPARPVLSACGTSWDRRPLVEFGALPAGVTLSLFKGSDVSAYATVSLDGQNYHRPATELGAGGPPPGAALSIYARACLDSDPSCCSTSDPVSIRLIEACTVPIAPSSANLVFSEYVIDGDGACPGAACEAGEAIEITNLSHCPVSLEGYHFSYCNNTCGASSVRYMNFDAAQIIPPRGVYVAIRQRSDSMCSYPFLGADDPALFGLRVSTLAMQGMNLASGWFANGSPGGRLRIASGAFLDMTSGTTIELVNPYIATAAMCESTGFDAYDACGEVSGVSTPTTELSPNQLGRLWRPCDAVVAPFPTGCL